MNFKQHVEAQSGDTVFQLRLADADLRNVKLSHFERAVIRECDSPDASLADRLLGLELLARRLEEALRESAA